MPARLKSGALSAPGGYRKGSGRKPDWFAPKCREFLEKRKLLKFVADVADGTETEQRVSHDTDGNPELVDVRPAIRDRLRAVEMLKDWGIGKEIQPIEGKVTIVDLIEKASSSE